MTDVEEKEPAVLDQVETKQANQRMWSICP